MNGHALSISLSTSHSQSFLLPRRLTGGPVVVGTWVLVQLLGVLIGLRDLLLRLNEFLLLRFLFLFLSISLFFLEATGDFSSRARLL